MIGRGRILSEKEKTFLAIVFASTESCGRALYPDRFSLPFSPNHKRVMELLDDDSIQRLAIAAPRGFGKSSIVQLAFPTRKILSRQVGFIVPISCTETQAQLHGENLKRELKVNRVIKDYFPDVESNVFAKDMWMVNNPKGKRPGTLVFPRGRGQQIRGFLHGDERPDLIIVDDLEDAESVMNPKQRNKVMEWFYADVLGCVDLSKKNWRVVVIGTVLHEDSLLNNLLDDPSWTSVRLEACDDEGHSTWPEKMDDKAIADLQNWYRQQGLLDVFYREYRNQPVAKETAPFKPEFMQYYTKSEIDDPAVQKIVLMDPARSDTKNSCDTAIVGVGFNPEIPMVYVMDIVASKLHPDEQAREAFAMADRIGARAIGYEVDGLEQYATWTLTNMMRTSNKTYELVALRTKKGRNMYTETVGDGKSARIAQALIPLYRQGQVKHNKNHFMTAVLEQQLLQFPRSKKIDIVDALSYIAQMMSEGERHFMVPLKRDALSSRDRVDGGLDRKKESAALEKLRREDRSSSYALRNVIPMFNR